MLSVDPPGVAPGFPACGAGVVLLDHEPERWASVRARHAPKDLNPDQLGWSQPCCHYTRDVCCRRKPWDSNPQADCAAACFQDRFLIQPDDFRASCGSWNRTNDLLVQSQASLPTATVPHRSRSLTRAPSHGSRRAAGAGVEPADSWFKATHFYRQKLPRNLSSRVPGGNRTRLASRPTLRVGARGWCLSQSATGTIRRKGRESNPQGREARPASNGVPSPVGLPFRFSRLRREDLNLQSAA